jgi:hypothetical protein
MSGILEELRAQGFDGNLSTESEYHWDNSALEVAQCLGFVRDYGAARKWWFLLSAWLSRWQAEVW